MNYESKEPPRCHCGEHDESRGVVCCPVHGHRLPPGHSEGCPERAREVAEYARQNKRQRRA
jgi:predicted nucleic acid-binding Zn ribbon protein